MGCDCGLFYYLYDTISNINAMVEMLRIFARIFLPQVGAFYRWLVFLGTKPYKYFIDQNENINYSFGAIVTFLLLVALQYWRTRH